MACRRLNTMHANAHTCSLFHSLDWRNLFFQTLNFNLLENTELLTGYKSMTNRLSFSQAVWQYVRQAVGTVCQGQNEKLYPYLTGIHYKGTNWTICSSPQPSPHNHSELHPRCFIPCICVIRKGKGRRTSVRRYLSDFPIPHFLLLVLQSRQLQTELETIHPGLLLLYQVLLTQMYARRHTHTFQRQGISTVLAHSIDSNLRVLQIFVFLQDLECQFSGFLGLQIGKATFMWIM